MLSSLPGVYFCALVRERCSLDHISVRVATALNCTLAQSTERGIVGDYVGEVFGLQIHLYVSLSDDPITDAGALFVFGGSRLFAEGTSVEWIDISSYIVHVLRERTALDWRTGTQGD